MTKMKKYAGPSDDYSKQKEDFNPLPGAYGDEEYEEVDSCN